MRFSARLPQAHPDERPSAPVLSLSPRQIEAGEHELGRSPVMFTIIPVSFALVLAVIVTVLTLVPIFGTIVSTIALVPVRRVRRS